MFWKHTRSNWCFSLCICFLGHLWHLFFNADGADTKQGLKTNYQTLFRFDILHLLKRSEDLVKSSLHLRFRRTNWAKGICTWAARGKFNCSKRAKDRVIRYSNSDRIFPAVTKSGIVLCLLILRLEDLAKMYLLVAFQECQWQFYLDQRSTWYEQ
jgi:hypothetical protein